MKSTAAGKYREFKKSRLSNRPSNSNPTPTLPSATHTKRSYDTTQTNLFLAQRKNEWQSERIRTESLEKLEGLWSILQSEEGKKYLKIFMEKASNILKKISINKVVSTMSKDQNFSDLLKNLGENGNTSEILSKMMNNPEMRKTAMDMMQDMMSDEKKLAELTKMMNDLLDNNK